MDNAYSFDSENPRSNLNPVGHFDGEGLLGGTFGGTSGGGGGIFVGRGGRVGRFGGDGKLVILVGGMAVVTLLDPFGTSEVPPNIPFLPLLTLLIIAVDSSWDTVEFETGDFEEAVMINIITAQANEISKAIKNIQRFLKFPR